MEEFDHEMMAAIGSYIRERRTKLGWTQSKACDRCGVSSTTWERLERGENAYIGTLSSVADGLQLKLSTLIRRAEIKMGGWR